MRVSPGDGKRRKKRGTKRTGSPAAQKQQQPGNKRAKGEQPRQQRTVQWEDVEGKKGPSGFPRMKGGNPDAPPCGKFFGANKFCPYETCSFSHVARK